MEWNVYIRKGEKVYKVFKIRENANNHDLTIIPHKTQHLSRSLLAGTTDGDRLKISIQGDEAHIDHFSAHSKSGERHVVYKPLTNRAEDIILGKKFQEELTTSIPLLTLIATTTCAEDKDPTNTKSSWHGYDLPEDIDYGIFDILAYPLSGAIQLSIQQEINNERASQEGLFSTTIPFMFCNIALLLRTSNHDHCTLEQNILFQQDSGKTFQIKRVSGKDILVEVSNLTIN